MPFLEQAHRRVAPPAALLLLTTLLLVAAHAGADVAEGGAHEAAAAAAAGGGALILEAGADASALLPDAADAADAAEATGTAPRTQAGCLCARGWRDAAGGVHSGCANPNGDPQGEWCAVSARSCPGYYASFSDEWGGTVYYDYCGDVRGENGAQGGFV